MRCFFLYCVFTFAVCNVDSTPEKKREKEKTKAVISRRRIFSKFKMSLSSSDDDVLGNAADVNATVDTTTEPDEPDELKVYEQMQKLLQIDDSAQNQIDALFAESDMGEDFGDIGGSGRLNVRTGQVQSFHARRGWGIIKDIKTDETFFVHYTGLQPQLPPIVEGWKACLYSGEYVEFVVAANETKPDSLCCQCVTGINGGELMCDRAAWRVLFYRKNTEEETQSPQHKPFKKRRGHSRTY